MPNLVGIFDPRAPEDVIRNKLSAQLARVRTGLAQYTEYVHASPGFGMALQDHGLLENGPQPARSKDDRFALILDGEIYNGEELRQHFRHELSTHHLTDPELCLALITGSGMEIVRLFNGLFVIALYDRVARRLTVISDRLGFRPFFYLERAPATIFATELKAITVVDSGTRRIDDVGTVERFCYGTHVIDRTWLEGYRRLPAGTVMTADANGVQLRNYWTYRYDEAAPSLDQRTYMVRFGVLLDRAVERTMKGKARIGIFLSGGYDSRAVAAALRAYHRPIPAFTFGYAESRDVRYAAMLAERLGLQHHAVTDRAPYLYDSCRAIVWRTDGLLSFAAATSLHSHALIKRYMDIVLLGLLAEFSGSHTWPRLLLARSRRAAVAAVYDRMLSRVSAARRVMKSDFLRGALDAVHKRYLASMEAVDNEQPLNVADAWNMRNVQPFGSYHAPSVDRHMFEIRAPHMDIDLVEFLLSIPPRARIEQRVYKRMIAHSFPDIRDVPCTNSGRAIDPRFAHEYGKMVAGYLGRKTVTAVRRAIGGASEPLGRESRDEAEQFRAEPAVVDNILRPMVDADIFPERIFDRTAINEVITGHYDRGERNERLLSDLVSWGLAVRYFLHDDTGDVPHDLWPR